MDVHQKSAHSVPIRLLLDIVAEGHILLKDLLVTCKSLPSCFTPKEIAASKFAAVLFDYTYFKHKEAAEGKLEEQPGLRELDDELQNVHKEFLEKLFGLLEAIVELHASILEFLGQLQNGKFIQCSAETLLQAVEGKQLFCEAIAILGCILLTLDLKLPGPARERLVVAFYRLRGGLQAAGPAAETVIALCADTGFNAEKGRLPQCYPETYFARIKLPSSIIIRAIHTIRGDDIYRQTAHFPLPEHRTAALASQASQLYLLLWFSPETLHNDGQLMRTLVDRHFSDNWVVAWGHGCVADLAVEWEPFKAARSALSGVVSVSRARDLGSAISNALPETMGQLAAHTSKAHLSEEYVLEHTPDILAALRQANVSLRWLLLHSFSRHRKLKAAVKSVLPAESEQLKLVLQIAQLEYQVKRLYSKLLISRHKRWEEQQQALKSQISGLQAFLTAMQAASSRATHIDFSLWFQQLIQQVDEMSLEAPSESSSRVQEVVARLDELERFYGGEAQLQTSQYLASIRHHLGYLMRLSDVSPDVLHALAAISDFSYGWGPLSSLVPSFQNQVRQRPEVVAEMLCLFKKVESMLEAPMTRLSEANSDGLQSTLVIYSTAIQDFAKAVLQVVPGLLWSLIDSIVTSSRQIDGLSSRVEVSGLKEAAMLEQRATVAEQASKIARLAAGLRKLDRCKIGVLELASQQLMEEGLRHLLNMRVAGSCATLLVFPRKAAPLVMPNPFQNRQSSFTAAFVRTKDGFSGEQTSREELESRLTDLEQRLRHLRTTIEHLGDLLSIDGTSLWNQQLASVGSWNLQKDSTHMVRTARAARRNLGRPTSRGPMTFMGRVICELMRLTQPDKTRFAPLDAHWKDAAGNVVCGPALTSLLHSSLGAACSLGMQQLLKLRIAFILEDVFFDLQSLDAASEEGTQILKQPVSSRQPGYGLQDFNEAERKCRPVLAAFQEASLGVGQSLLLLRQLSQQLGAAARNNGGLTLFGVDTLDRSILTEESPSVLDIQQGNPPFIHFSELLERCGFEEPLKQKFSSMVAQARLPELVFLLLIYAARGLPVSRSSGGMVFENHCDLDPVVFSMGLACVMHQMTETSIQDVLKLASRWISSFVQASTGTVAIGIEAAGVQISLPGHVASMLALLNELCSAGVFSDAAIADTIPFVYTCTSGIVFEH